MRNLFLGLLASLILALGAIAKEGGAKTTYEYARSTTEQGKKSLLLDFYAGGPGCTAPRPTVVYIHGGGFRSGSRNAALNKGLAPDFTAAGINLVSISYRLAGDNPVLSQPYQNILSGLGDVSDQGNYPGQVKAALAAFEDANKALKYVVDHAGRDCVNVQEVFLMGSSAGAVTALNVAYGLDEAGIRRPSIEGVIDFWGAGMPAERIGAGNVPLFIAHGEKIKRPPSLPPKPTGNGQMRWVCPCNCMPLRIRRMDLICGGHALTARLS